MSGINELKNYELYDISACFGDYMPVHDKMSKRCCDTCPIHTRCINETIENAKAVSETIKTNKGSVNMKANDNQVGGTHYKEMGVQPWDVIDSFTSYEQKIGFYRGNALKYIMRMGSKDESVKEIEKARHYLDKLLEVLKNDN